MKENKNIFFSIAIPVYKGKYLKECISSILSQTYKNFELIIVNDFSPDDIDDIIRSFNDERISYYKNTKNIGLISLVKSWNVCLNNSKGDYFILIGDDDTIEKKFLEEFQKPDIIKYPNLDIYQCRCKIIDS